MAGSTLIPTVWRVDVEPDQHQPAVGPRPWDGFAATVALIDKLRDRLGDRSGRAACPTWMLRMDPDIERCFGRADFVVCQHAELFDRLIARGDPMGIHVHHYRWNAERAVAFSDHADGAWTTHCLKVAVDAFKNAFGEPLIRASHGGYFLDEAVLDAAVELGIRVDLTVEPGLAPMIADPSLGAYATAPSGNFIDCPRHPYYPSRRSLDVACTLPAARRPILLVPLTSFDYAAALRPWHRQIAHRLLKRPDHHLPLSPWKRWRSPKIYWDLVERAADEQPACYFAFATRTDDPSADSHRRVWELLDALPDHPIAERLQFVDPLAPEIRALAR